MGERVARKIEDALKLPGGWLDNANQDSGSSPSLGDWVLAARTRSGMTQEQIGHELNRTKANISAMENGRHVPSFDQMVIISRVTGYPMPTDVAFGQLVGRPASALHAAEPTATYHIGVSDDKGPPSDGHVHIRESNVEFSAGNGVVFHEIEKSTPRSYSADWLHKEGIRPERAIRARVKGDSMEEFLFDGDTVLINLDETEIKDGKIYALRYGDELRIKQL